MILDLLPNLNYDYISYNMRTSSSLLNIVAKSGGFTKEMAMQVSVFQIFIDEDLQPNQY